jgi:hypothetical protein
MRYLPALGLFLLLPGCMAQPPVNTAASDDRVCRSFMRNKEPRNPTTYDECRQSLVDLAKMPGYDPQVPNVTVIINR